MLLFASHARCAQPWCIADLPGSCACVVACAGVSYDAVQLPDQECAASFHKLDAARITAAADYDVCAVQSERDIAKDSLPRELMIFTTDTSVEVHFT